MITQTFTDDQRLLLVMLLFEKYEAIQHDGTEEVGATELTDILSMLMGTGTTVVVHRADPVLTRNPYRDPSCPERVCDRAGCGCTYRGPAVYCSMLCALLDA